ncbi:O-antigen ligase family protein, partial [Thiomicrorhabdus heinhorstiae]
MGLITLVLLVEILLSISSNNELLKAVVMTTLLLFAFLIVFLNQKWRVEKEALLFISIFLIIVLYGVATGIFHDNNLKYLAGDFYHTFFEILIPFILVSVFLRDASEEGVVRSLIFFGFYGAIFGFFAYLLSFLGVLTTSGNFVGESGIFRLYVHKLFPVIPLLMIVSTYLSRIKVSFSLEMMRKISIVILLVLLIFTFKRSMWVAFILALPFLLFNRKSLFGLYVVFFIVMGPLIFFFREIILIVSDYVSYNESYTLVDTLSERVWQYAPLIDYFSNNVWGYGFGAEFVSYDPETKVVGVIHYIHSLYLNVILQVGLPGALLILFLLLVFLQKSFEISKKGTWMIRMSLAGLFVIAFSGIGLLST